VVAQVKTEEKSNEITAIPALLEMIALKGCIVTIDAMGCQYKIANQIVSAGADYVFSLKENQETLYDDVKTYFEGIDFAHPDPLIKTSSTFEVDHGRQERRNHAVTDDVSWLVAAHPVLLNPSVLSGKRPRPNSGIMSQVCRLTRWYLARASVLIGV
jgi:predicted transposase YbfD/YdcC